MRAAVPLTKSRKAAGSKRAVVLLSGGLDSATALYFAKEKGLECFCLTFDYGQRHKREVEAAEKIASYAGVPYKVIKINLPWQGSALLDKRIAIPSSVKVSKCPATGALALRQGVKKIPSTYVPARNIIFLSFALSYAEAIGAGSIFIGAHSQDYSGYPDCRPEFYRAFNRVASKGTRAGVEKKGIKIEAPLIDKGKAEIIRLGLKLGVPFALTWSCYAGGRRPCGRCESCYFRGRGFKEAGATDPALRG